MIESLVERARPKPAVAMFTLLWRASRPRCVVLGLLGVLSGVMPMVQVLVVGMVIGAIPAATRAGGLDTAAGHHVVVLVVVLVAVGLLTLASRSVETYLGQDLGYRYELVARELVADAMAAPTGMAHLSDPVLSSRVQALFDDPVNRGRWGSVAPFAAHVLPNLWMTLAGLVIISSFAAWAAVLLGMATCLMVWIMQRLVGQLVAEGFGQQAAGLRRYRYLRDTGRGVRCLKETRLFDLSGWTQEQADDTWVAAMAATWRSRRRTLAALLFLATACTTAGLLVGLAVVRDGLSGEIGVAATAVYLQALVQTLRAALFIGGSLFTLRGGAEIAAELLSLPLHTDSRVTHSTAPPETPPALRFERVCFSYPRSSRLVLNDVDLEIAAGRSTAIVGVNGVGKTTLVGLIARLHEPTAGRITVDGTDLALLDPVAWRDRLAVLFQDFIRYPLSLRDNLDPAGRADDRAIGSAIRSAGAEQAFAALPGGLTTVLATQYQDGVDLSGGQWQRVALARALVSVERGAQVLILDEPTASLDIRAEAEIFSRFLELTRGLTTVLISHRFASVRRADHIVVLEAGRIAERGSHDELIQQQGHYAQMFQLQASRFLTKATEDA